MLKRCFDVFASIAILILATPVFVLIAGAIWLTDGCPIIFRQKRLGRGGAPFTLYKFRSMRSLESSAPDAFNAGDTSRITCVGGVLRSTKLDEIPQLWNVLRGDMSLVGPRPEVAEWVSAYPERWSRVHQVRPGITDPASIAYCHEEEMLKCVIDPERVYREEILPQKLSLNEQYVCTQSFWGDMRIIVQTVAVVLRRRKSAPTSTNIL